MYHRPIPHNPRTHTTDNYARHIGREAAVSLDANGAERIDVFAVEPTGEYVFFGFVTPMFEDESQWAFWRMPHDADLSTFTGKIIGR